MKTNSIFKFSNFGSNMLFFKIPESMGAAGRGKRHYTHKKDSGYCIACADEDYWRYPAGYGNTHGGKGGYDLYGGYGYDAYGYAKDPYGMMKFNDDDCKCTCPACKLPKEKTGKYDSSEIVNNFSYTSKFTESTLNFDFPETARLQELANEVGTEAWGNRFFKACTKHHAKVTIDYAPFYEYQASNMIITNKNDNTGEVAIRQVDFTFGDIRKCVMSHEIVEAYDRGKRRNDEGDMCEVTSRLTELILLDQGVINETCAGSEEFNNEMRPLLNDILSLRGNMTQIEDEKWGTTIARINELGYNITKSKIQFDATTILEIAGDYALPGYENGYIPNIGSEGVGSEGVGSEGVGSEGVGSEGVDSEGVGSEGVGSEGCDCNCICSGCKCRHGKK